MNISKLYYKEDSVNSMSSLYEILSYAAEQYGSRIVYEQLEGRTERSQISFRDFRNHVEALRASLVLRGFEGHHAAVWGESCWQWVCCYHALVSGIGVAVPVDRELPVETIVTQLSFADVDTVFCTAKAVKKLLKVLPECPNIRTVILLRTEDCSVLPEGVEALTLDMLLAEGRSAIAEGRFAPDSVSIDPNKMALIIFTSGTTGANKGVMLSNRNIMGTLRGCARLLRFRETSISVLPIHHSFELHAHLMSALYCGTTVFFNDDLKHLLKNLNQSSPEMSCMVPMMLDLLERRIKLSIHDKGKDASFGRAVKLSNALRKVGIDLRSRLFSEVIEPFGGKLDMIICGGAALSQDTIDFFDSIGIRVFNGYGITECSPVAAVNPGSKRRRFSVGHVLPTVDVRVAEPDAKGNGELQLRGDNVMLGYYKAPEDTAAVFTEDGWFRTGDLGHCDKDKYIYISGRLKNLIILANGKNISPEEIEEHLQRHIPYIKECVVFADNVGTGIYALCYLDPDYCREHALDTEEKKLAALRSDLEGYNRDMPTYKRLSDVRISETEFEKNTSKKIQRYKVISRLHESAEVHN